MRAAIIKNGVVANIIVVESLDVIPGLVAGECAAIGDLYVDGQFVKPPPAPPVIPESVTMRQARLALLGAGLLAGVNAAIAGMQGDEGEAARIEWEYAQTVERSSALVAGLAAALNLSAAQLDALFLAAALL